MTNREDDIWETIEGQNPNELKSIQPGDFVKLIYSDKATETKERFFVLVERISLEEQTLYGYVANELYVNTEFRHLGSPITFKFHHISQFMPRATYKAWIVEDLKKQHPKHCRRTLEKAADTCLESIRPDFDQKKHPETQVKRIIDTLNV